MSRAVTVRERSRTRLARKLLAAICCASLALPMPAQQLSAIAPIEQAPAPVGWYVPVEVPPVRLANSGRLAQLVRAAMLYLTRQDAIAAALENNIDLEIARYGLVIAPWRLMRAEAGGALPGVPSAASQAGSVAAGQGVAGSQAAAGVRITGTGQPVNQTANATITQIGPVTQTLDPTVFETSTFSHNTIPQPNIVQSITPVLISNTRAHTATIQKGFLTGSSVSIRLTDNYLNENSPTDLLNPSSATNLQISVQQALLRGFGIAVNARNITVSRMNLGISAASFTSQVIAVVARVLSVYYNLAASYAAVKAQRSAVDAAQALYNNVQARVRVGALAPIDLVNAEQQLVTSRQALVDAQATLDQQEVQLKNLLSRTGTADPVLAGVRILPVDSLAIPTNEKLPPVEELVQHAIANRSDIAAERMNLSASQVLALGTRNGLLPNLQAFASETQSGLAGTGRVVTSNGATETANPYFVGGVGTALAQTFRRNFPSERGGAFYQEPVHNRQAQADFAIDQLQLRQSQLGLQRDLSQVEVSVRNYVAALEQARARYQAAVKNVELQQELLRGEQEKYSLGASTPYNVVLQQRDLVAGQSAVTSALVAYYNARVALDQATGDTLAANGITIEEARSGNVPRRPVPPPAAPSQP